MPFFDRPTSFPRRWGEYSFDFRLFYIWEMSLFAAIFLGMGGALAIDPRMIAGVYGVWLIVLLGVALRNRRARDWRWPGLTTGDAVKAVVIAGAMALFCYVVFRFMPLGPATMPMFAFGVSIAVFNSAVALKLVQMSETEFAASCGDRTAMPPAEPAAPLDPSWKRAVRGVWYGLFGLVWLEALTFFYFHGEYIHDGARTPGPGHTEFIADHGTNIYITHAQMQLDTMLRTGMMVGIPLTILLGLLIHFGLGVTLYSNLPQGRGIFGKR